MKKLILLTICTILLLTGCGQAAAPEVDTVPAIVQEETIPTTDTQDVPTGIAEVAVEPTISYSYLIQFYSQRIDDLVSFLVCACGTVSLHRRVAELLRLP